ncbi:MAG: GntR family transcriptional regulator [Trebonia sp.]
MRKLDPDSRVPPWQQIAGHLRDEIKAGKYQPDTPVPSITTLSQQWEVNRKTVRKAMAALVAEGLIDEETGMGYFVKALAAHRNRYAAKTGK